MKKLLFVLLMVLSLVVSLPAQAAVETLANFTFDSKADYANGGNAKAVVYSGSPEWKDEYEGRNGVMYFDGSSGLSITKSDGSPLLTNVTDLTVSFKFLNTAAYESWHVNDWIFTAYNPDGSAGSMYWGKYIGASVHSTSLRAECPNNAGVPNNASCTVTADNIPSGEWNDVQIQFKAGKMTLTVNNNEVGSCDLPDLTELLGSSPAIVLGQSHFGENFTGYIDDLKITGEKSIRAALNPFNTFSNDRPNLYNGLTLKVQGSDSGLERIVFPVAEGAKITLPSEDSLRSGFTIGDTTYVLEGELENPRKLIGWYNIADGNYYSVLNGDAKGVALSGNNDVFYGDWIASSYDFLGDNTDGLITTADTSEFIDINVFDYSELVNVNSMTVRVDSESWSVYDNRENGWLAFSDWGTYESMGSIGFPNNRDDQTPNGYNRKDAYQGLLDADGKILNTMFNQNSKPENKNSYVPGINYLGKGNYLFSYDPATGMYSYNCETNAAVYQQSEGRFYVYDAAIDYISDDNSSHNPDFFPLNKKTDTLNQTNGVPNYWFGLNTEMEFWLPDNSSSGGNKITNADGSSSDMIFEFKGDDDMWVFIDDKLVLDIGGIHDEVIGTINFSTGEVIVENKSSEAIKTSFNFSAGDHTMKIYYLERGGDKSNCTIKFNLLPEYEVEDPGIDTVQVSKDWVGTPDSEVPPTITVELYDANKGKDSPAIKTATFGIDEAGKWAHSFSNLPHTDKNGNVIKYAIREVGLPQTSVDGKPYFDVDIATKVTTYSNAWVFTDMAGLAGEDYVVIGNGKGQVLGFDLKAHDVAKMDVANNIITQLASNRDAANLLWTIEPATSYQGGKHFYLKNGEKYLCISSGTDGIHLHDKDGVLSVFYLNASGDLQDATTGHRLVAKQGGFDVETNVGGNVTTESANKASLYVMRTRETTAYTFKITNTYVDPTDPMGTLQISKTIGGNAAKDTDEFTFLVTLKDEKGSLITGTFGNHEFKNGQCRVTLKNGDSASILLPEGAHYTVTETGANGYELITPASNQYAGTIIKDETAKCPFHNELNLYALTVSKSVTGNAADTSKAFAFTVTLTDKDSKALTGTLGNYTFDANGQAVISIAHSESFTIPDLPDGTKYTVSEENGEYTITAPALTDGVYAGEIEAANASVEFVNSLSRFYTLTVSKTVTGNAADTTKEFAFTVTLTDKDGTPMVGTFGNYTFDEKGQCVISIAHSESFTIPDLPDGTKYTISEENGEYTITAPVLTDGVYAGEIKAANASVEFVNALSRFYTLTVSKTVTGNAADTTKEFAFTVTLTDANGAPMVGEYGEYTFDEKGQCVISIAHDESFTIPDLPDGTKYTVSEDSDGYTQTAPADKEVTGTITTGENKVDFVNERNVVRLVKVTDPDSLTVAPNVTVTGDDGSTATAALTANDDASYLEIPVKPGVTYTVAETGTDIPGYAFVGSQLTSKDAEVTVSGMTFTVSKSGMTTIPVLTLTNTYAQGGLTVKKTIGGNAADKNDEFTFTVTLTDKDGKPVSGTFGEHTFVGGKCTFTLKGNESENFADLPIGVTYTVTETPALGYVQTAPTEPATGVISTEAAVVSFTNERWAVDIQKQAIGLNSTDTVAPKVTVGDVVIDELPADGKTTERIFVTPGKAYTVAEENAEVPGYTLVSAVLTGEGSGLTVNGMGFTLDNTSTTIPVLTLTNTYAQGGLTVSKTVKGNATSADDEFTFTVTLTDADGKPVSGTFDTHTFVDGKCTFTLKGNESENFADLPIGVTYTVTETPALGYVQTAPTEPATGVISTEAAVVSFTNERWAVDIQKQAIGLNGTDTVAPKVTVGDVVIDELPADGKTTERIFVTPGTAYAVAEEHAEVAGYTLVSATLTGSGSGLTVNGMGFTLSADSTTIPVLTLTNTYAQGGLTVKKTIGGNAADKNDQFTFTVTLTDKDGKAVSGTFGEHTFVDGKCAFTLKGNESENFADLPIGVTYTVTETPALGYVQTAPTEPATGVISTEAAVVSFTNERWAVDIQKQAIGLNGTDTVAPKVTVGDVVIDELPADGVSVERIFVTPGTAYAVAEENAEVAGYTLVSATLTGSGSGLTVNGMGFTLDNTSTSIPVLTLTNTYAQGGLTVSKTVKGNATSADDEFTFTVTLTDADGKAVSGTFGEHTFVGGKCTFTLKGNESENFADLPIGVTYTVTEAPALGYVQTAPTEPATGVISTEAAVVSFTNERWAVDIQKKAVGLTGNDTVAPKVTVGDVVINALPADGKTTERIFVTPGTAYAVAEENAEVAGYTLVSATLTGSGSGLTVNGMGFTLSADSTTIPVLTLTNTYAQGGLTVSKTVKGNAADKNDEFTFTVTLTDADGKPVSGTFGEHTFVDGKCSFTLKGNESENFADLPIGVTYTVTEAPALGYVQTAPTEPATGVISTEPAVVSFTNVRDVVRLVKVTDPDSLTVAPNVTVTGDDGSTATAALTANDDASYLEIPVKPGVTYTVAETGTDIPGYAFVGSQLTAKDAEVTVSGMTFTVSKSDMTSIPVLTLTNTYAHQGGLTVKKTIGGNAADKNDEFTFTVTLTDKDGKPVSGTFGEHTFVGGKCTFTLKGNESENFADLPIGVTYTVTETPALGYVQTAPTEPATGVISTEAAVVSFTNERWAVDIQKQAIGLNGTDTVAPKVTVGDVVIDELPADGKTTERIFVTPGTAYAVAEEHAEVAGYTLVSAVLTGEGSGLTVNGMGFTLDNTSTTIPVLTLTNTYAQGGLTVKKTIGGNAADKNDQFTFTVTLTDADGKPVSGTFDTHTFVDGKCTFTLKGNESENFADLPIGVTYTVTEAPALGYVQTAPTAPATGVISTEPAVVSFTNVRDVVRLVKVTDPTSLTVAPKVTVSGSDGSVVTAEALTANNAAKYLEIPVKPGVTYTVAEIGTDIPGYTFVGSQLTAKDAEVAVSGMTFTVGKSGMTTIPVLTLSNAYTLDSVTVTIRKVSTGLAEGIAYPAPKVSIYAANSTAPVWTGTLTPNGSALPVKLLPGTYTVKEVIDEVEGYGFTSVLYVNGAASADKTFTLAVNAVNTELRLENFYAAEFSTLTLTKTVKGESGSKTGFSFRITLTDDKGQPITERFPYTGTMDGAAPLTGVITSGSTVALRDGGSITVQLPLGVHYEVEEQEQEGYVLVSSEGEKGVIEKDGAKAAFVNKPQYTVTVTKVWEGDTADVRPASVQVQLMLNGKPVGNPVTLNAANGWKHTYTGLDAKGPYTIDELTMTEGYVSTVEEGEGNTFVITNSYIVLPPTGDAAHPALYLLALLGSAALLMLLRKRKAA